MCSPGLSFRLDFHGDVKWRVWKVPLGRRAAWVTARNKSQRPCLELAITRCCETVTLHYVFTIDICLGKGNGIQCVIFISALLPVLCFCRYLFLPSLFLICLCHSLCLSFSISLFLSVSLSPPFLWNVMIHWLWSVCAVSLKSVRLLSTTTEWYITSITCNFLGFYKVRLLCEDCSVLQLSLEYLTPRPCSWKPLSGVGMCQYYAAKLSPGNISKLGLL